MSNQPLLKVPVPCPFNLELMVFSHGWVDLPPFGWDPERQGLTLLIRTREDRAFALEIKSLRDNRPGQELAVFKKAGPRPAQRDRVALRERIVWCFRLEDDFSDFQEQCAQTPGLEWVKEFGLGPFLRNPDLFEEFAKILFTTNINWAGTKGITGHLLRHLGLSVGPARAGFLAFPTAGQCAGKSEAFYRQKIRLGYRAPFFRELAKKFAREEIDRSAFQDRTRPIDEVTRELGALKGFGPYAVNALLLTFGRFDRLILDSWIRKMVSQRYFKGRKVSDKAINKIYAPWGKWACLACWFECAYDTWFKETLENRRRPVNGL